VFALDLMSTYEGEHTIFGLLGQANLTQNDVLQFWDWSFLKWFFTLNMLVHMHLISSKSCFDNVGNT
jgi:hypothetical protein